MRQAVLDQKQAIVDEISTKIKESASCVVVEYHGLNVAEVTELRKSLREEEVELKVYKNSMAQRACDNEGFSDFKEQLKGPNAIAFGNDAVAPSRVLAKFAKKHENLVLKGAIVDGKIVGVDTIMELSTLPNKDGMLSMLLSCLQSPVRSFALAVKAVSEKREEASAEVEPAEKIEEAAPAAE